MSLNMMLRFGGAKREADVPETLGQQIAAGIKAELEDRAEYEDGGDGADPPINGAEVLVMHDVQPSARERWDEDVRPDGEGVEADCEASDASPPLPMSDNMTFAVTRNLPGMPRKGAASVGAGSLLWVALQGRVAHPESVEGLLAPAASTGTSGSADSTHATSPSMLDKVHLNGETPLHFMIRLNDFQWCSRLLTAGCSTEVKGPYGYTAAHYAVQYDQADILVLLIKHGANLQAVTPMVGQSSLHIAARQGSLSCAQVILREDGTGSALTSDAPLEKANTASLPPPLEAPAAVIETSAPAPAPAPATAPATATAANQVHVGGINCVDSHWGWTPLHYAAMYAQAEVATLLDAHGASCTIQDSKGYTPLHLAAEHADHATVSALASMTGAPCSMPSVGMLSWMPGGGWTPVELAKYREKLLAQTDGVGGNIFGNRVKPILVPTQHEGQPLPPKISKIISDAMTAASTPAAVSARTEPNPL